MRILRLKLIAFGHFTDLTLDFSAQAGAVQLVYGPNEAGKSTTLRALRGVFYGIEPRSSDGFLHANDELRIGAGVRRADGTEFEIVRRKGNKNTLLDSDGSPADEALLRSALNSVDEDLFVSLFGIDHDRLVGGGRSILRGGGQVGESLFAAGLGGASLRSLLEKLDEEAAELFRPQGRNQKINFGCREYKEQKDKITEYSVPGREYEERAQALELTRRERNEVVAALQSLRSDAHRLERISRALPLLPARRALREELQQLGEVPILADGFSSRRLSALAALSTARAQIATSEEKIKDLQGRIAALPDPEPLVTRAGIITELHQRLGSHRKAARELPALRIELRTKEKEVARLLSDLKLAQPEASHLGRGTQRKVQSLANQHQALVEKVDAATRTNQKLARQLEANRQEIQSLPDIAGLREVLDEAQRHGDLEGESVRQHEALRACEAAATEALKRLGLWNGTLEELARFPLPVDETIDRFDKEWQSTERTLVQSESRIQETQSKAAQCEREIQELLRTGSVPSETDLAAARARREEKWHTIRAAWLENTTWLIDPASMAESYESDLVEADELADRLRREATRVALHARLTADRDLLARQVTDLKIQALRQEAALTELKRNWSILWRPLEPLPPGEMRGWIQRCHRVLDQIGDLRTRRQGVAAMEERIERERAALGSRVGSKTSSLRTLLAQARGLVDKADQLERDTQKLTTDLDQAQAGRIDAEDALRKWQTEWRDAMGELGRDEATKTGEANEFIADCAEMQKKLGETEQLRIRIEAIHAEAEAFERESAVTFAQFHPEGPVPKTEEAINQLHEQLTEARQNAAKLAEHREQFAESTGMRDTARSTILAEELNLAEMCRHAGCTEPAELESIEKKSSEAQAKRARLEQLEERIQVESGGAGLGDFIAAIETTDADGLTAQIAEKQRLILEADERRSVIDQKFGAEDAALKAIDGNARAAEAAESSQAILGQIEEHAERFIRLRLASAILRREIERYRAANQDPLLKRAGELFRTLTLESFAAITTDFDSEDNPILKGQRPSGQLVTVEGMSEGTRDQLFFALQLASVEKFLASCGPMPFIVDDVLIGFDQEREAAVLRVLAELAQKTQVIIFTHHRHLVELAERTLGGAVDVHRLESRAGGGGLGTSKTGNSTSNIQHPTPNIQNSTSNTQHPTSNIQ